MKPRTHNPYYEDPTFQYILCPKRHVRTIDQDISKITYNRRTSYCSRNGCNKTSKAPAIHAIFAFALACSMSSKTDYFGVNAKLRGYGFSEYPQYNRWMGEQDNDNLEEHNHIFDAVENIRMDSETREHTENEKEENFYEEDEMRKNGGDQDEEFAHKEEEHVYEKGNVHVTDDEEHMRVDDDMHGLFDSFYIASESSEATDTIKPWGKVIGATIIVNLVTLIGLLILVLPAIRQGYLKCTGRNDVPRRLDYEKGKFVNICIPSFAVGALMATAVFLAFPEAMHLIGGSHQCHTGYGADERDQGDHDSEHRLRYLQPIDHSDHDHTAEGLAAAKFGVAVLGGFLIPIFFSILFDHEHHTDKPMEEKKQVSLQSDDLECESCKANDDCADIGISASTASDPNANANTRNFDVEDHSRINVEATSTTNK
ncbi:hypothetical protein ACHAXS_004641 [Conticribra weissflogii]